MTTKPITVIRAGSGGRYASKFEESGLTAVGFTGTDSVANMDRTEIARHVASVFPDEPERRRNQYAGQLHRFAHGLQIGDIIVMPEPSSREFVVGEVAGPYEFRPEGVIDGDYKHVRRVRWCARRSRDDLSKSALFSLGSISTVFQPNTQAQAEIRALIQGQRADSIPIAETPDDQDEIADDVISDLEARSRELIANKLAQLDDNEMEQLVAGILRAMGYHTQLAPEGGGDGGVDVLAARDPLFVEPPIIKVQVKQRTGKAAPADIRALAGVLDQDERGIFVSMGGFSSQTKDNRAATRITLIDASRLQQLLMQYYDQLDQDTKALLPLRRLYFPPS